MTNPGIYNNGYNNGYNQYSTPSSKPKQGRQNYLLGAENVARNSQTGSVSGIKKVDLFVKKKRSLSSYGKNSKSNSSNIL